MEVCAINMPQNFTLPSTTEWKYLCEGHILSRMHHSMYSRYFCKQIHNIGKEIYVHNHRLICGSHSRKWQNCLRDDNGTLGIRCVKKGIFTVILHVVLKCFHHTHVLIFLVRKKINKCYKYLLEKGYASKS